MRLGLVGLGKMGGNMAARLRDAGHQVVGFDPHSADTDVASLGALIQGLGTPRAVWLMVPAGDPTEEVVSELSELLAPGDVVVDGGNANWRDSVRRARLLDERDIGFVDCGTSGGVWGRTEGYSLMVGGAEEHVARLRPAFEALRPPEGGFAHVGAVGTGHFTKMVHNGIEYGLMQSYAEGFELLARSGLDIDVPAALEAWRHGSVVRSWLLDLLVRALAGSPGLEDVAGVAADSGEGRWTVTEAVERGVPVPAITAALNARFTSQDGEALAMRAVAALRHQFGGHAVSPGGPGEGSTGDSTSGSAGGSGRGA